MRDRPLGVWILTVLAGLQFVLAIAHFLQALGILPYVVGEAKSGDSLWYAIVWAFLIWVWAWVTRALYTLNPQGWLLVLLASGFAAIFNFINMAAATQATPGPDPDVHRGRGDLRLRDAAQHPEGVRAQGQAAAPEPLT